MFSKPSTRGRKAKCVGHLPKVDCSTECRYCFEAMKDGSMRATKIKYCDDCNGYHSAKNFKREQEKHSGLGPTAASATVDNPSIRTANECLELDNSAVGGQEMSFKMLPVSSSLLPFNTTPSSSVVGGSGDISSSGCIGGGPTLLSPNFVESESTLKMRSNNSPLLTISEQAYNTNTVPASSDGSASTNGSAEQESKISLFQREAMCSSTRNGNYHTITLSILEQLAQEYVIVGYFDKALNIFNKIIEGRERTLGFHHEDTLRIKLSKANLLLDAHLYDTAEMTYRELVEQLHSDPLHRYNQHHPLNLNAFFGLASTWQVKATRRQEPMLAAAAEEIFGCVYGRRWEVYGEYHVDTIKALQQKGHAVEYQGRFLDALAIANQTLLCATESNGKHDPLTIEVRQDLLRVLFKLVQRIEGASGDNETRVTMEHLINVSKFIEFGNVITVYNSENDDARSTNEESLPNQELVQDICSPIEGGMTDDQASSSLTQVMPDQLSEMIDDRLDDLDQQGYTHSLIGAISCLGKSCDKQVVFDLLCLLRKQEFQSSIQTKDIVSDALGSFSRM